MADCLFCRIIRRELPANLIYETPTTLAFRDIKPGAPVHALVVPKEHIESLYKIKPDQGSIVADIHWTIQEVARRERINQSGFRVVVNNGGDAMQAVPHLHYHVLGGRRLTWPPG